MLWMLESFLQFVGLISSEADPALFLCNDEDQILVVVVYVDDVLITEKNKKKSIHL